MSYRHYSHTRVVALFLLSCFLAAASTAKSLVPAGFTVGGKSNSRKQVVVKEEREGAVETVVIQHDEEIQKLCSNATAEERRRFLVARLGNVKKTKAQLEKYLEWRGKHDAIEKELNLAESETDEDDWNAAVAVALYSCEDVRRQDLSLPRIARVYTVNESAVRDCNGHRVLHVMPGQMDTELCKASTYGVALALYIDRKLHRASLERLTIALDVRGGYGWPNVPPLRQLPFIKTTIKLLLTMFPERLATCLLFPVPRAATWIWNMIQVWIDPLTSSKIHLLTGPAKIVSEPPLQAMQEFLEPNVATLLEKERCASFLNDTTS